MRLLLLSDRKSFTLESTFPIGSKFRIVLHSYAASADNSIVEEQSLGLK